jgi:hypothetical protein
VGQPSRSALLGPSILYVQRCKTCVSNRIRYTHSNSLLSPFTTSLSFSLLVLRKNTSNDTVHLNVAIGSTSYSRGGGWRRGKGIVDFEYHLGYFKTIYSVHFSHIYTHTQLNALFYYQEMRTTQK